MSVMKSVTFLLPFLALTGPLVGQGTAPEPQPPSVETLARSVVFLTGPEPTPRSASPVKGSRPSLVHIGTGFLVGIDDTVYLVTAEHVAAKLKDGAALTYASDGDRPVSHALQVLCGGRAPSWLRHATADVAVLQLSPPPSVLPELLARSLSPPLLTSEALAPPRSRPLTTIGFPLGLGVVITGPSGRLSPITRESKAVSGLLTIKRFDTKTPATFFLLDSPSIGGFSGSPVFMTAGAYSDSGGLALTSSTLCVGLIHGTLNDKGEGRLTAVVPAADIAATLTRAHSLRESSRFRLFR